MNQLSCTLTWLLVGAGNSIQGDQQSGRAQTPTKQEAWEPAAESTHGLASPTGTSPPTARHAGRRAWPGAAGPGGQAAYKSSWSLTVNMILPGTAEV